MTQTNQMRRGFTMIELIFVIVIIGILAAVAIPKLAGTRDDAKIAKIITNTKTVIEDVKKYVTAQGQPAWDKNGTVLDITDVPLFTDQSCSDDKQARNEIMSDQKALYICGDENDVVKFTPTKNTFKVEDGSDKTSSIAKAVQNDPTFKSLTKEYQLAGRSIKR